MSDIAVELQALGIRLRSYEAGDCKTTCPQCSQDRRKKADPCLSVTIDTEGGAVWNCHHCSWADGLRPPRQDQPQARRAARAQPAQTARPNHSKHRPGALPPETVQWFAGRGISEATLKRNGVGYGPAYIPEARAEMPCIWFPYFRDSEVVNFKFRDAEKRFAQVKGAEKILCGLDDIRGCETVIITEGEIDKLSLEEAGYRNAVSVPDGAPAKLGKWPRDPEDDRKFSFLWNCKDELAGVKKFILAGDADDPGRVLMEELARRLGRERCWRVAWPTANDAPRKDPNEVLMHDGADVLRECIENAQPYPIRSLWDVGAFESETLALYRDGPKRAFSTGWESMDRHMRIREGELSVVTGVPGSGKSEFIDALMVNLANKYGWRFAVCSFENPPTEHIAKLAEKYLGQPFWDGLTPRMGERDLREAMGWLREHFYLIRADDESPTIDWILETARAAVLRYGVRGLIVDPYNELEHHRPSTMSETEYVSQLLAKVKRFAQGHGVHVWFVAHPAKMHRDAAGKVPVPTLYDISGSANWANKADLGVVVHRDWQEGSTGVEIYVRKVRFKAVGKLGMVRLDYDPPTGRYNEAA